MDTQMTETRKRTHTEPKAGDVWIDLDYRIKTPELREFRIISVDEHPPGFVVVQRAAGITRRIKTSRLNTRKYRFKQRAAR